MTIKFTRHSVERYRQFYDASRSDEEIASLLVRHAPDAVKLAEKTRRGHTQWHVEALGATIVTKRDRDVDVCVTILPPVGIRGLTPGQADRVYESIGTLERRVEDLRLKRGEVAAGLAPRARVAEPPAQALPAHPQSRAEWESLIAREKGSGTKTKMTSDAKSRLRLMEQEMASLNLQLKLLVEERFTLSSVLKTMRAQDHAQNQIVELKNALRATMRYLRTRRDAGDAGAESTWQEVYRMNPGLCSSGFVDFEYAGTALRDVPEAE